MFRTKPAHSQRQMFVGLFLSIQDAAADADCEEEAEENDETGVGFTNDLTTHKHPTILTNHGFFKILNLID